MTGSPTVLVISFSPIARDSRVLRQLSALTSIAEVTSVGYGDPPPGVCEHIRISDDLPSLPQTVGGVAALAARRFTHTELSAPAIKSALSQLGDRRFDVLVANDARAVPLAFALSHGSPVWADMHEWAPEERTHVLSWRLLVAPLMDHICRTYLPRCAAVTTVSPSIAELYATTYGVEADVIQNAASFADLQPSRVSSDGTIRLVHSGGAVKGRAIETMLDAVQQANDRLTLDLYLVPGNDGGKYLAQLKHRARGCDRIRFHMPVSPQDLPATLNQYDVGIYWIPPYNTNARLALPNKLFDFIQARLAVAVGPTQEMAAIVKHRGIGVVSRDYSLENIVSTLNSLTTEDVTKFKLASHAAATDLSFETEASTIHHIITRLTS
ncbi:MAG: glycosyltransferase [Bowdeniella nasicola]|nr:glycosyltransferase [Bowdeniella nasicola]